MSNNNPAPTIEEPEANETSTNARTQIRRIPKNARDEKTFLYDVIDASYICHVAFADDMGTHCIPTASWREGDYLYIHGANASRMVKQLKKGVQVCVTITHLDGLVLARSAFSHSMNYRSAMIYGQFEVLAEEDKAASMAFFLDRMLPGRQAQVRAGSYAELAGTTILRIALEEFMCKSRTGGPNDDEDDMSHPVWAGVLPLHVSHGTPIACAENQVAAPDYVEQWATAH